MAYKPHEIEKIKKNALEFIENGGTLWAFCHIKGNPHTQFMNELQKKDAEFSQDYTRARQFRSDFRSDQVDVMFQKMLDGEITEKQFEIFFDKTQWQTKVDHRQKYGDRTKIESEVKADVRIAGLPATNDFLESVVGCRKKASPAESSAE